MKPEASTLKLNDLIDRFTGLSFPAKEEILAFLLSNDAVAMPDSKRLPLWESLISLANKHRRHPDAGWVMPTDDLTRLEEAAARLTPSKPLIFRRLFSGIDFDLYEQGEDWEAQRKKLETTCVNAVREVFVTDGFYGVLNFSKNVAKPGIVGSSLAMIDECSVSPT